MKSRFSTVAVVDPNTTGRTAIRRGVASAPLRKLLDLGLVRGAVLYYGCGHGDDVAHLRRRGFSAAGWDPVHRKDKTPLSRQYDTVLCTYVLNVLPKTQEMDVLTEAWQRVAPGGTLYATVRRDIDRPTATQRPVFLQGASPLYEGNDFAIYGVTR